MNHADNMAKSTSGAWCTRHRLANTNTCPQGAFRCIAKSWSAAGLTRRWFCNTSTSPLGAFWHLTCILQLMMTLLYDYGKSKFLLVFRSFSINYFSSVMIFLSWANNKTSLVFWKVTIFIYKFFRSLMEFLNLQSVTEKPVMGNNDRTRNPLLYYIQPLLLKVSNIFWKTA